MEDPTATNKTIYIEGWITVLRFLPFPPPVSFPPRLYVFHARLEPA